MFRIDRNRLIEVSERWAVILDLAISKRAVRISDRKVGVDLNRLAEIFDGALIMAGFRISGAARVVGDLIVGIALDHVAERSDVDGTRTGSVDLNLCDIARRRAAKSGRLASREGQSRAQR